MFGFVNHTAKDLNEFVTCNLCNGYLIDATTLTECMHSFCKTCIVKYLENFSTCPICNCQLHKGKPYLDVKSDNVLQSIVYLLFPSVFEEEKKRRKIHSNSKVKSEICYFSREKRDELYKDPFSGLEDDFISVELIMRNNASSLLNCMETPPVYLLCPLFLTIGHLSKFLAQKFQVSSNIEVWIFRVPNSKLNENSSIVDIISSCRSNIERPLCIYYSFITPPINEKLSNKIINLPNGIEEKNLFFLTRNKSKSFSNGRTRFAKNQLLSSLKSHFLQNV
uniref:Polycomb complex protein Bmi-1 n=1 Tax=Dugesia japonica TaxID=6161 RepID=A0A5J6BXQ8_DUGJA|nr:polycomb complex protein Bmi-1 [Dugesia japonica]